MKQLENFTNKFFPTLRMWFSDVKDIQQFRAIFRHLPWNGGKPTETVKMKSFSQNRRFNDSTWNACFIILMNVDRRNPLLTTSYVYFCTKPYEKTKKLTYPLHINSVCLRIPPDLEDGTGWPCHKVKRNTPVWKWIWNTKPTRKDTESLILFTFSSAMLMDLTKKNSNLQAKKQIQHHFWHIYVLK